MKLIILDRDGIINRDSDEFIKSAEEWEPLPGSLEAITRLNQARYRVVVATNQSGIGRGIFDVEALNRIHDKMRYQLTQMGGNVDAIFFCPHHPDDACACRKPKPGLLLDIAARLHVPLAGVPVVGDSMRDIDAARAAGARPVLVLTGKGKHTAKKHKHLEGAVPVYRDLSAAVDGLLAGD